MRKILDKPIEVVATGWVGGPIPKYLIAVDEAEDEYWLAGSSGITMTHTINDRGEFDDTEADYETFDFEGLLRVLCKVADGWQIYSSVFSNFKWDEQMFTKLAKTPMFDRLLEWEAANNKELLLAKIKALKLKDEEAEK